MVKTKTEIKKRASQWMNDNHDDDQAHGEGFVQGYTEAQQNMMKYEKGYHILYQYYDSISDEQQVIVSKKLEKLGL